MDSRWDERSAGSRWRSSLGQESIHPAAHSNAYYDRNFRSYADKTGAAGAPALLDALVDMLPHASRVADIGCGAGRDLAILAAAGIDCVGYDLSPQLAAIAQQRSGVPVVVTDMRSLTLPEGALDGALAIASLLHLDRHELPVMMSRIGTWLRPGGLFLASMKLGRDAEHDAEGRSFTFVEIEEWQSLLAVAGLRTIESSITPADRAISSSHHPWIATLACRT